MVVTVYADATGLFTEEEYNLDNLCEIDVPDKIVEEYYKYAKTECDASCIADGFDPTFYDWYHNVYTAEITDDFLAFAADRYDYKPVLAA